MRYDKHPTWQMLEKSKQDFKTAINDIPSYHPLYKTAQQAHDAIVKLQLELESKLLKEMSDE